MKLLSPLLIELSYVEPEKGLLERLNEGGGGEGGEGRREVEDKRRREMFEEMSGVLLRKSLGAVCHPFKQCRTYISTLLMSLSGVTAANFTLGIEGNSDSVVMQVRGGREMRAARRVVGVRARACPLMLLSALQ